MLQTNFKIKDLGDLKFFLGIDFSKSSVGVVMHHRKYMLELISNLGLLGAKPMQFPMDLNITFTTIAFNEHTGLYTSNPLLKDPIATKDLLVDFFILLLLGLIYIFCTVSEPVYAKT